MQGAQWNEATLNNQGRLPSRSQKRSGTPEFRVASMHLLFIQPAASYLATDSRTKQCQEGSADGPHVKMQSCEERLRYSLHVSKAFPIAELFASSYSDC